MRNVRIDNAPTDSSVDVESKTMPSTYGLKALAELFYIRTWPYIKPESKHVFFWVSLHVLFAAFMAFGIILLTDLWSNKVLVGEPLEPAQATFLQLDTDYVETDSLTDDQRRVVRDRTVFYTLALYVLIVLVGHQSLTGYYETWIVQRINQNFRVAMIEHAEHLSLRYHSHARTGDAIYRVIQDSAMISNVIDTAIVDPISLGGRGIFAFFVVWMFSPLLGLICLIASIPILGMVVWFTPRLQFRSWHARQSSSNLTSRVQEVFAAIRVIKATQSEEIVVDRFKFDSKIALDTAFLLRLELVVMWTLATIIAGGVILGADYLMASWTIAQDPTWLAGAIALVGFVVWNFGAYQAASGRTEEFFGFGESLIHKWGSIQDIAMGLERAFYILDLKSDVVESKNPLNMPTPVREIRYRKVRFGYDSDRPVLNEIDLVARAGTVTAIVGGTGSGKSTLMSMLLRLYDPDDGVITINDLNLKEIQIDELRAHVAIALQQNVLFASTVAENIGYAVNNVTREEILEASRITCADAFIEALDNGLETELGERGAKLSTGERQRISVARAVVRNTPILILDEPTSALDAETEQAVMRNLRRWGRERVLFLITHRISTIRGADQIAFLEDGRIVEMGDHDTLMGIPSGRYREFVQAEITNANQLGTNA